METVSSSLVSEDVFLFVKHLTDCQVPNQTSDFTTSNKNNFILKAHTASTKSLKLVENSFANNKEYWNTFFPLIVEECRQSKPSEIESFFNPNVSVLVKSGNIQSQQSKRNHESNSSFQCSAVVEKVLYRSERLSDSTQSVTIDDISVNNISTSERSQSVWILNVKIVGDNMNGIERVFSGGNLLYMSTPQNIAFLGLSYSVESRRENNEFFEYAKIYVCVSNNQSESDELDKQRNGWVDESCVAEGMSFTITSLKNITPSVREVCALRSFTSLSGSTSAAIKSLILTGSIPVPPNKPITPSNRLNITKNDVPADLKKPPMNVPVDLWNALLQIYNNSQLQAIRDVCIGDSTIGHNNCFSLLQGPPGTGKTKTILGIVAVLLAGAGAQRPQRRGVAIVPGATLAKNMSSSSAVSTVTALKKPQRCVELSESQPSSKPRVLICAPSNITVDELTDRLLREGVLGSDGRRRSICIVRVGLSANNLEEISSSNVQSHNSSSNSPRKFSSQPSSALSSRISCVSLEHLVDQHRAQSKRQFANRHSNNEEKLSDIWRRILESADVVCCTLSGAGSPPLREFMATDNGSNTSASNTTSAVTAASYENMYSKFAAVVIDEASQAVEPAALIPLVYNPKAVVLVGDPNQLPPTVFSQQAKSKHYDQSLFQRLARCGYPVRLLDTQYRMHREIAAFPSQQYYENKLKTSSSLTHDSQASTTASDSDRSSSSDVSDVISLHGNLKCSDSRCKPFHEHANFRPVCLHDVDWGAEASAGHAEGSTSLYNEAEAQYVLELYVQLLKLYPNHGCHIAIISPYRAQRRLLTKLFHQNGIRTNASSSSSSRSPHSKSDNLRSNDSFTVEISTIDAFQGREVDVVIFSTVRSRRPPSGLPQQQQQQQFIGMNNIGFLSEKQRLNVAITRSKYALWIVGDLNTLETDQEWAALIRHARERQRIIKALPPNIDATAPRPSTAGTAPRQAHRVHSANHHHRPSQHNHASHTAHRPHNPCTKTHNRNQHNYQGHSRNQQPHQHSDAATSSQDKNSSTDPCAAPHSHSAESNECGSFVIDMLGKHSRSRAESMVSASSAASHNTAGSSLSGKRSKTK